MCYDGMCILYTYVFTYRTNTSIFYQQSSYKIEPQLNENNKKKEKRNTKIKTRKDIKLKGNKRKKIYNFNKISLRCGQTNRQQQQRTNERATG